MKSIESLCKNCPNYGILSYYIDNGVVSKIEEMNCKLTADLIQGVEWNQGEPYYGTPFKPFRIPDSCCYFVEHLLIHQPKQKLSRFEISQIPYDQKKNK